MTELFDAKWISKHGETPSQAWVSMLGKMTEQQIFFGVRASAKKATDDFKKTGESWPPSLPEFIALCLPPRRLENGLALPPPRANREFALKQLAKIRAALNS